MPEVDPQEFGRLVGTMEQLAIKMAHIEAKVEQISTQMNKGKGVIAGMLFAAGGIGAGASHFFERLFK